MSYRSPGLYVTRQGDAMSDDENDAGRDAYIALSKNARCFERELIAAKLEAELFIVPQGDERERAWRDGWNERARSLIRELRGGS